MTDSHTVTRDNGDFYVEVAEVQDGPPQTLLLLVDYEEAIVVSPTGGVHSQLYDLFL